MLNRNSSQGTSCLQVFAPSSDPLSMSLATGLAAAGTNSRPSALNSGTFDSWLTFSTGVGCGVCWS